MFHIFLSFWVLCPQAPYRGFAPGPHWGTYIS